MSKIRVLGMEDQREALIGSLMNIGAVEISAVDIGEYEGLADCTDMQEAISGTEGKIADVHAALACLDKYSPEKKGLFQSRREVTISEFNKALEDRDSIWAGIKKVRELEERLARLKTEENRVGNLLLTLLPWKEYSIPLEIGGTKKTIFLTGTIPAAADIGSIKKELAERAPYSDLDVVQSDRDQHYVFIMYYSEEEQELLSYLKTIGFGKVSFPGLTGTVEEISAEMNARLQSLSSEREEIIRLIKAQAEARRSIEALYDDLGMQKGRTIAAGKILSTGKTFLIKGWIPEKLAQKAKDMLEARYTVSVEATEPGEDEEFPVLLENSGLPEAGEPVSRMYSLPNSREIDPNAVMAPFFVLFFGLMLSDGGYGIIMALLAGFLLLRFKLEDSTRKFIKLIFFCGISTIFWGFLFGSWFGIEALAKYGVWLNPVEEPELLLSWSLLFGVIHMYAGFGLKAANLIRDKKILDAVFDVGFVFIFYTGFIFVLLPFVPKVDKAAAAPLVTIGQYMFVAGAVLLIFTQGRDKKNIFGKFFGGLSSLYNVVGFMSDVLSYSRLLALGLATGIIASIINQMSVMFDFPLIIKVLLMIAILFVGHIINFAINALGAYVHSCRLQYLEFFGKFFTGGGTAFKPLKADTKYIAVKMDADM